MTALQLIMWLEKADASREVMLQHEDGSEYQLKIVGFSASENPEEPGVYLTLEDA